MRWKQKIITPTQNGSPRNSISLYMYYPSLCVSKKIKINNYMSITKASQTWLYKSCFYHSPAISPWPKLSSYLKIKRTGEKRRFVWIILPWFSVFSSFSYTLNSSLRVLFKSLFSWTWSLNVLISSFNLKQSTGVYFYINWYEQLLQRLCLTEMLLLK